MEQDYVDMLQIYTVQPDVIHTSLMINNESMSNASSEAMFDMFRHLVHNFDVMISYGESDFRRSEYFFYIISDIPIDERLGLLTDVSLNFAYHVEYFYTNQRNIENGVSFFLLNNRIDVRFYPITAMGTIRGGAYFFIARSQSELDEVIAIFMAEFDVYVDRIITFDADSFDTDEAIESFLSPIIIVTMALIALVTIMYIHTNSKKIAIIKTMGIPFHQQVKQLFLPLLLVITLTIAATNLLLFTIFVNAINERTIPILWTLVHSVGLQLLGVVSTLLIGSLLLLFIPSYSLLKNSSYIRFLMGANYFLKIAVLIVMIPFLSGRVDLIQDNLRNINHVNHYERNSSIVDSQFSPNFMAGYFGGEYYSVLRYLWTEVGIRNVVPEIIYEHPILYEYHRAFHILNKAGAIFCRGIILSGGRPGLLVNENFLERHPVQDINGNEVSLHQSKSDAIYLIPEMYMDVGFSGNLFNQEDEVIIIKNEQNIFDYSLEWIWAGIPTQPYIIRVYRDTAFRLDASPFRHMFFDGDFNGLLRDTSFYNRILVSTVGEELNRVRELHTREATEHILVMTPTFALVLVIIIQYSYLYSKVYQKRIYAQKIMGYSSLRIFSRLLFESSLAVIVAISVVWYLQLDIRLLVGVLMLEVIAYLATVAYSQWRQSLVYINE